MRAYFGALLYMLAVEIEQERERERKKCPRFSDRSIFFETKVSLPLSPIIVAAILRMTNTFRGPSEKNLGTLRPG